MIVSFTGHRRVQQQEVRSRIHSFLEHVQTVHDSVKCITGGAVGTDIIAAEVCKELRIPYVVVLPFPFTVFTAKWGEHWKDRLRIVCKSAEKVVYLQQDFDLSAYQRRNKVMVDESDVLFAVYDGGGKGGAFNTIQYAYSVGASVQLWDEEFKNI